MFTRTRKNARNKEYASLFMEAHGVHKAKWRDSLSLILMINNNLFKLKTRSLRVVLHKPSFVEEEEEKGDFRGDLAEPEVQPSFPESHPSCSSVCGAI